MSPKNRSCKVDSDQTSPATAAIWLRVSDGHQHTENQEPEVKALAKSMRLRVVKEYRLDGVSAWHGEQRSILEVALEDGRRGAFRTLVVWALDRLSREGPLAVLRILNEFDNAGVRVVSVREPWLAQDDMRDIFASFAAWNAKSESERRSDRVKAAQARLRVEKKVAGTMPWAYRWPSSEDGGEEHRFTEEGVIRANPERAATVRMIFDTYVHERVGVDKVVAKLHDNAIPSPKGSDWWSRSALQSALSQRAYALGVHDLYGVECEPIVDRHTYERAQKLRVSNNRFKPPTSGRPYPFQGAICGGCGSPFGVDSGGGRYRHYFCRGRYRSSPYFKVTGDVCQQTPRLRADVWELAALEEIIGTFTNPENAIKAIDTRISELRAREATLEQELAPLERRLGELESSLGRLADDWVEGILGEHEVQERRSQMELERENILRRVDALGPDSLRELERTRVHLAGALDLRRIAKSRAAQGIPMGQLSLHPDHAESDELIRLRESNELNLRMPQDEQVPGVLSDWLTRLHADVYIHEDRIEIRGAIDAEIMLGDSDQRQTAQPGRGLG